MSDRSEQGERHLFLSPHYDDIALSCGGTTALLTSRGHRPEIALIFGQAPDPSEPLTPFAVQTHTWWGLEPEEVIRSRQNEEAATLKLLGASERGLPFRDAIYRGDRYGSEQALFSAPAEDESGLAAEIVDALGLDNADPDNLFLYAPLAIGRHVDHQIAFRASLLLRERGFTVRWYEDLPYALDPTSVALRLEEIAGQLEPAESVAISEVWETKIDAIMTYGSQLQMIFGRFVGVEPTRAKISEALLRYAEKVGDGVAVERFWKFAGEAA